MLMDRFEEIRSKLARMIGKLPAPPDWREDLLQEALVHFWQIETTRPGDNESWRLTSCRYHLRHLLRKWRSVDALQDAQTLPVSVEAPGDDNLPEPDGPGSSAGVVEAVCAREELALLMEWLTPTEQLILSDMGQGLRNSEIGRKRNLAHQAVADHRKNIKETAIKLGIPVPRPRRGRESKDERSSES